ncbi:MAG: transcription-repair coupling factor, partial [Verrucomicrobia bacterium]
GELENWYPKTQLFPELELAEALEVPPDPEIVAERLSLLQQLARESQQEAVVAFPKLLESLVWTPQSLLKSARHLKVGQEMDLSQLMAELANAGYERAPQVFARGQFAVRGGIVDIFSWQQGLPIRVEFFGNLVESLREFNLDSQISIRKLQEFEWLMPPGSDSQCALNHYIRQEDYTLSIEGAQEKADVSITARPGEDAAFFPAEVELFHPGDFVLDAKKRELFFSRIRQWQHEGWCIALFCNNEGEQERFSELCEENGTDPRTFLVHYGTLGRGFIFPAGKLAVLSDAELFGRSAALRVRRLAMKREHLRARRQVEDFATYEEGDLVVHADHGIGRYLGLMQLPNPNGILEEVLAIEFADEARLYVPLTDAWRVARYVGLGRRSPGLSRLGDPQWQRSKTKAQQAIAHYAKRLLEIQVERETQPGFAFPPDTKWQREFEQSFLYKETPDQQRAIAEVKEDMEKTRPMDRLICGDVGFGKTEVAIRAAFKAVLGGKQVAFLAPTTVLAQQHWQNLRERFSDYPISIELLSRYRSQAEQRRVICGAARGEVDIIVGTHRLISKDVEFARLGLLIVDEEQRFGVKHKDFIKERFRKVDVLTLSATPIPRTLYLALAGARDMSLIETPPSNRQPVETIVCGYDERVIREAIQRERERGGQVFFLHNRVQTIEKVASRIRELCPNCRVAVGHGQMGEHILEEVMSAFVEGKCDVLVSTSIIESGLDIPNANTILIDRSDRFGLADLYQLRGRVGRSGIKAYAFLMLPRDRANAGDAWKRISAIRQYSELGAGFKIAMRDLEIRGAGNILGTAQSGHILAIGFEMYCKLLKQAMESAQGKDKAAAPADAGIRLDFLSMIEGETLPESTIPAFLPSQYIPDTAQRIEAYRKLAEALTQADLKKLQAEWRDRFGILPDAVKNLITTAALRIAAAKKKITLVETRGEKLLLTRKNDYILLAGKFPRIRPADPKSRLQEICQFIESLK